MRRLSSLLILTLVALTSPVCVSAFTQSTNNKFHRSSATIRTQSQPKAFLPAILSTPSSSSLQVLSSESLSPDETLSAWEQWCVLRINRLYRQALTIKCPFMRRRASDLLDAMDQIMRFLVVRHKSLHLVGPPPGWRCDGDVCEKSLNLPLEELMEIIRTDWRQGTEQNRNKGYYITGRLNTTIYRDDCLFDGPDPDMPVKGLRKYLNAASQLFDQRQSRAELLHLSMDDTDRIVAEWKMTGVLMLPWRPVLPEWTGRTVYYLDGQGLVYLHREEWDMSVLQAFTRTFWPSMATRIWDEAVVE